MNSKQYTIEMTEAPPNPPLYARPEDEALNVSVRTYTIYINMYNCTVTPTGPVSHAFGSFQSN